MGYADGDHSAAQGTPGDHTLEELHHATLDHMLNALALFRVIGEGERVDDFVVVQVNKAFVEHTGLRGVEGRRASELNPSLHESDPWLFEALGRVARTGVSERFEARIAAADQWYELAAFRVADDHVAVVFEMVTARRRTLAALHEREVRLRAIFELAPVGIVQADMRTGRLTTVNERMCAITGYTAHELMGKHFAELTHPDDRARDQELFTRLGGREIDEYHVEKRYVRKGGDVAWVSVNVVALREGEGAAGRTLATVEDITERKRAQARLDEASERYRSLVDHLDDVVFTTDLEGRITFANRATKQFGYRPEELIGRSRDELIHPDDLARIREQYPYWGKALEYRLIDAAGKVRYVRSKPRALVVGDKVVGATGLLVDLTAQRNTEEQLRVAHRMEAVGRLAGGVAHDFNNLLTVILSYTQFARDALAADDPMRDDLGEVERAARRAEELTRQLLAFSRRQMLRPEALSLNDLVYGLSKMLDRIIGEDVALTVETSPHLASVLADRGQLEQVIMNLVVNARDAMPDGGRVTVSTADVVLEGPRAASLELAAGCYVELVVRDTGHGMDAVTCARVFEPFFTTKAPGKGTGLGLSMVYGIVKQSGGGVEVESAPGQGATFRVYLPRSEVAAVRVSSAPIGTASVGSEVILLVEDEPALRRAAHRMLSTAGYEVLAAGDADEAQGVAAVYGARIRLLVTDVVLPGMSGKELADRLTAQWPAMRVLFTSGYTDETIARHGVLGPDFLAKPYEMPELTAMVRRILDAQA